MEPKANYILIGAFTIAVSLALFVFVVWLGKYSIDRDFDYYDIIFEEAITGLGQRGTVMFNGIQVGEVTDLKVDPTDPSRVITRVRVNQDTPVRMDTRATLGFMGFTGQAYIEMEGGSADSPMLLKRSEREIPLIVAETSELQSLLSSGGSVFSNINDLVTRLNELITEETMRSIEQSILNIEQVIAGVAENRDNISTALSNFNDASADMQGTMQRLQQLSDELLSFWERRGEQLGDDLTATGNDVRTAAAEARELALELRGLLQRNAGSIDQFADQGLSQVGPALKDMRSLLQRLDSLLLKLEENPAGFLINGENVEPYRPAR
jgi:phospholipid/cholesterol/gamma-HCH transport system substrate-binding protein